MVARYELLIPRGSGRCAALAVDFAGGIGKFNRSIAFKLVRIISEFDCLG